MPAKVTLDNIGKDGVFFPFSTENWKAGHDQPDGRERNRDEPPNSVRKDSPMIAIASPGRSTPVSRHSDQLLSLGVGPVARSAVTAAQMPALRKELAGQFKDTLTSSVVKNADEQSLVALVALSEAIAQSPMERADEWGVIAAPRFFGRTRCAEMVRKFREQGAWSASPHIIPQCMLHSLSGLLSQAFGIHGPNIGAGGSRGGEREALLAAFGWISAGRLPGVWLVLTSWDSESPAYSDGVCTALAVGLQSSAAGLPKLRLLTSGNAGNVPPFSLESLGEELSAGWSRSARWEMGHMGSLSLEPAGRAAAAA